MIFLLCAAVTLVVYLATRARRTREDVPFESIDEAAITQTRMELPEDPWA